MTSHRPILFILLALALIRGTLYAAVTPPWQAPDEPAQFERARASLSAAEWAATAETAPPWYDDLAQSLFTFNLWDFLPGERLAYNGDAPLNAYISLYQEIYIDGDYSGRPPYMVMGSPLFLARNQSIALQLYLVRLMMVLLNVGIIFLAYLTTRTIFPHSDFLALGVPILILFNPQHTYLLATVNNGNLAEFLTTLVLFVMVRGIIKGFSWPAILIVLLLSLAAMWTKATAYFLPIVLGLIALFYLWQYRRHWRWLLPTGVVIAALALYFAPERLYVTLGQLGPYFARGGFYLDPIVPTVMFRSFWAMPGWLTLQLHPVWYQLVMIAMILAVLGLIILLARRRQLLFDRQFRPQIQALLVLAAAALVAVSILLGYSIVTQFITFRQGRSIYPVIVPISLFIMLGWRQLIPARWRNFGLLVITAALFLFDSLVLFNYVIPFFYSRY